MSQHYEYEITIVRRSRTTWRWEAQRAGSFLEPVWGISWTRKWAERRARRWCKQDADARRRDAAGERFTVEVPS